MQTLEVVKYSEDAPVSQMKAPPTNCFFLVWFQEVCRDICQHQSVRWNDAIEDRHVKSRQVIASSCRVQQWSGRGEGFGSTFDRTYRTNEALTTTVHLSSCSDSNFHRWCGLRMLCHTIVPCSHDLSSRSGFKILKAHRAQTQSRARRAARGGRSEHRIQGCAAFAWGDAGQCGTLTTRTWKQKPLRFNMQSLRADEIWGRGPRSFAQRLLGRHKHLDMWATHHRHAHNTIHCCSCSKIVGHKKRRTHPGGEGSVKEWPLACGMFCFVQKRKNSCAGFMFLRI